jgi:predicted secreted acid phosphatase
MWGTKWFMLTNSMYGGWEAAIYNFNYPDNEDTATEIRMNNLKP